MADSGLYSVRQLYAAKVLLGLSEMHLRGATLYVTVLTCNYTELLLSTMVI